MNKQCVEAKSTYADIFTCRINIKYPKIIGLILLKISHFPIIDVQKTLKKKVLFPVQCTAQHHKSYILHHEDKTQRNKHRWGERQKGGRGGRGQDSWGMTIYIQSIWNETASRRRAVSGSSTENTGKGGGEDEREAQKSELNWVKTFTEKINKLLMSYSDFCQWNDDWACGAGWFLR